MRFYISDGSPELEIEENKLLLADFLGGDIQSCDYTVNFFEDICTQVKAGKLSEWDGTGNAFTTYIKPDGVVLENAYTFNELKVSSIEEFQWYLTQWKRLLDTRQEFEIESPFD